MRLYHRTFHADVILTDGFRDGTGSYLTDEQHSGVWLSDWPVDDDPAGQGHVITVDVPDEVVAPFEWVEPGKGYREFLVPAVLVNAYPRALATD